MLAKLCSDENVTRTASQSKSIISIQAENTEEIPREIYIPPQKKKNNNNNKDVLMKFNT